MTKIEKKQTNKADTTGLKTDTKHLKQYKMTTETKQQKKKTQNSQKQMKNDYKHTHKQTRYD